MKFLFVGGDKRTIELIEMLRKDGHKIKTYALENTAKPLESEHLKHIEDLQNQLKDYDAVIGPIPFSKDEKNLNAPFTENKISIDSLLHFIENQTLITGPISANLNKKIAKHNIKVIDIMKVEELVIYNTIATAEGTIEIAISNTEKNLHESKILILGFGRVAKTLALKLKGLSKQVTCAARKAKDFAWIDTLGINIENINSLEQNLNEYDIIINTVPQIILTEERIKHIKEDALIIDLASKPGGVDQKAIKKAKKKYIWALALPGKVSPLSSAKYIKEAIYNIIDFKPDITI